MRRCPHCQAPNPEAARHCMQCGRNLPAPTRQAWARWDDLGTGRGLGRSALAALPALAWGLSCGAWLAGGPARVEERVLAYHLAYALLLALGLAAARRERQPLAWAGWLAAGLAGGAFSEGLDLWFNYRQIFSGLAQWLWAYLGLDYRPSMVYETLQALRLLGALAPLALFYAFQERRPLRLLLAPLWLALAVLLRSQVRGALLSWAALAGSGEAWAQAGLFYASGLALLWGLGPRGPEERRQDA